MRKSSHLPVDRLNKLIYQMYIKENLSPEQIADELGVIKRAVYKYITKFGYNDKKDIEN